MMKWFLRRTLVICVIIGVLCTAAIVVGRLDHSPSKLETYGLDLCDGEPCFRGIKIGTDLRIVKQQFPNGIIRNGYYAIEQTDNTYYVDYTDFHLSPDGKTVDAISVSVDYHGIPLPFRAEDVIAKFGTPCRTGLTDFPGLAGGVFIIYPKMTVGLDCLPNMICKGYDYAIQKNFLVTQFSIGIDTTVWGTCDTPLSEHIGLWRGFTSAEIYHQHNLSNGSDTIP